MKLFSKESREFHGVVVEGDVRREGIVTIRNGRVVVPDAGDSLEVVGVISRVHEDGSVDIVVRNKLGSGGVMDRSIDFWEDTLNKLSEGVL